MKGIVLGVGGTRRNGTLQLPQTVSHVASIFEASLSPLFIDFFFNSRNMIFISFPRDEQRALHIDQTDMNPTGKLLLQQFTARIGSARRPVHFPASEKASVC